MLNFAKQICLVTAVASLESPASPEKADERGAPTTFFRSAIYVESRTTPLGRGTVETDRRAGGVFFFRTTNASDLLI